MQSATVTAGPQVTQLYGIVSGGTQAAGSFQVVNLDTVKTVTLGNVPTIGTNQGGIPLGPLASQVFDGTLPVYAVCPAGTVPLAIIPGGSGYSPGSLNISGAVTANISGPVTVDGSVGITGTPTVDLASGTTVDIAGTANVQVQNATLTTVGNGGYMLPGQVTTLFQSTTASVAAGATLKEPASGIYSISSYQSVDFAVSSNAGSTATGAAYCMLFTVAFTDPSNTYVTSQETFGLPAGGIYEFSVPCTGPGMFVQISNQGSTGTITLPLLSIIGSFRSISGFQWNNFNVFQPASDSTITWIGANNPAGNISKWISSGSYFPSAANVLTGVLFPPAAGLVTGYYQVNDTANTGFANNAAILDIALMLRGGIAAGAGNNGTLINIPKAIQSPNNPTLFNSNFPVCIPALLIKSTNTTANLQFTAVQQ
jgi:hypothetical protein